MIALSESRPARYTMLIVAIVCQLATIVITWPTWQTRDVPVSLPWSAALPEISFGWAMVASLVLAGVFPKLGIPVHWFALLAACAFDQYRLQPQFFGLAVLMLVYFGDVGLRICRWYLVAMWVWTGIHKLLSPEWMGHVSWTLIDATGLPPDHIYRPFALFVAVTELGLGLLACWRPRWAAKLCVVVHLGIVVFLSPLVTGMNYSVIPWNLAIACIGCWTLVQISRKGATGRWALPRWEWATVATLMLVPSGFYVGWVDRCFCHVMYSDGLPRGLITSQKGTTEIDGYRQLAVPFPRERRLLRLYFARTAKTGDKLHIADPRSMLPNQFFVMRSTGPQQIDAVQFFAIKADEVGGTGIDEKQSLFELSRSGIRMLRESEQAMVYAVAFTPQNFDRRLLSSLEGLPNLRQIQFSGTDLQDSDLAKLKTLRLLSGLGLNQTQITDQGLSQLDGLPYLRYIESDGTAITECRSD